MDAFWDGFEKRAGIAAMAQKAMAKAKPLAVNALPAAKQLGAAAKGAVMKTPGRAMAAGAAGGIGAGLALGGSKNGQ